MTVPQTEPPPEPIIPDPEARGSSSGASTKTAPGEDQKDLLTDDELIDEQGMESFPASDPPAH